MGRRSSIATYQLLARVTVVGLCVLVVAGAIVRLTGSGLGCDDWPNCNEQRFIDVSTGHAAIEQLNRLLSAAIGVPTLGLAVVALRATRRGSGLRWPAFGVLATVLANGVVGGIAVRRDLHPALVQSHFLLAMASIALALVALRRAGAALDPGPEPTAAPAPGGGLDGALVAAIGVLTALALVTGTVVTGAGPHAGERDVRRFGFDIGGVARIHSGVVIATVLVAGALAWRLAARDPLVLRSSLSAWTFVAMVQGAIGYAQYFTGVPELLVAAHVAGATLLWVLTVRMALEARSRSVAGAERGRPADRPGRFAGSAGSVV
ncbi:COX15/CtaA family protein [Ilumatobacter sp.]|uniref:COX15/CtaA family protein n=1 Tax=Ilumatobacter sp. TaxID=1967498 RepID=UPI003B52E728